MATVEKTQFSIPEFESFLKEKAEKGVSFQPTPKQKYMERFGAIQGAVDYFAPYGGIGNIQRVRVMSEFVAGQEAISFTLVTKLPPALVAERKRQAEREARKAAFLAEMKRLSSDPTALKAAMDAAIDLLGRAVALSLLRSIKSGPAPKASSKPPQRKPAAKAKKFDLYAAALRQDKHNRIEASKAAAQQYHQAKEGKAS